MEEVNLKVNRSDVIQLFNGLLALPKSILIIENEEREKLLNYLWTLVDDRTKYEALWNNDFRKNVLNNWNISYEEDLIRLNIPKGLED
ncbi:hypothetical protein [Clostridium neonatale]|uniref:hypothetical protein n=1 Tax=Clostridium neonatale TaxID=137838 RepID=UPI00291B7A9E|nr:hypothetical protein [Clostridium neonatale]CAI3207764.1 hypothetical protein CNEO2_360043 [Clostridium neonatale]